MLFCFSNNFLCSIFEIRQFHAYFYNAKFYNLQTCSELQIGIEPYKCENAKLVQECNQVHLELIRAKEENLRQSYEYKKYVRKLESEQCNLQKSLSRSLQRIRQLEIEASNKTRKITELLGKCKKPNFNHVNFGKLKIHFKLTFCKKILFILIFKYCVSEIKKKFLICLLLYLNE